MSVVNPSAVEKSAMAKIIRHIIPLSIILYIINIIDRGNLGYAALDMNKALSISPEAFGSLTAMFFVGYFFFEIPSNMLMHRTGARLWLGRIMFTWGLVTCGMFWAQNFTHVAILRILLGIMEAGFFPGMMYYFTFFSLPDTVRELFRCSSWRLPSPTPLALPLPLRLWRISIGLVMTAGDGYL